MPLASNSHNDYAGNLDGLTRFGRETNAVLWACEKDNEYAESADQFAISNSTKNVVSSW